MVEKRYRIEEKKLKGGATGYYLVKDLRFKERKAKVSKYLGTERPDDPVAASERHALELELNAARKRAEMSVTQYRAKYEDWPEGLRAIAALEKLRFEWQAVEGLLHDDEVRAYEEAFEVRYVHGTTAIEGNTLSVSDTRLLLREGIVPPSKGLREINEVQNFRLVKTLRDAHRGKVTLGFIRELHAAVMNNIDHDSAGRFRRTDLIGIAGRDIRPTPSVLIEEELAQAIDDYYAGLEDGRYPLFEALRFHHRFEVVHPFTDGNGRVGREVLNYMLLRARFPRLLFLGSDRERYLRALQMADQGHYRRCLLEMSALLLEQRSEIVNDALSALARGG